MMTDLVQVLAGEPAGLSVARSATDAPRWYRLRFRPSEPAPSPGLLRLMAGFWGGLGTVAVNPVVVALVKWKKRFQRVFDLAKGVIPVIVGGGTVIMAWFTQHRVWRAGFVLSAAVLLSYFLVWLRARVIQKREDSLPIPLPLSAPPQSIPTVSPPDSSDLKEEAIPIVHALRIFIRKWKAVKDGQHVICSSRQDQGTDNVGGHVMVDYWEVIIRGSDGRKERRLFDIKAEAERWIEQERHDLETQGWSCTTEGFPDALP
jgi:hypothetical protein